MRLWKRTKVPKVKTNFNCGHWGELPFTIRVFGSKIEIGKSKGCPKCTAAYLQANATRCGSCKKPILPGESVAVAHTTAAYPYTHVLSECCPTGAFYCGRWGEGKLITLHELEPDKFPEGTTSVAQYVMDTGTAVSGTIK